jgi:glycosyltransferase involved in cell wall biosynthesis
MARPRMLGADMNSNDTVHAGNRLDMSIVVPVYNEEENIKKFHKELSGVLDSMQRPCEIVYVDDGSTDRSPELLRAIAASDPRARVIFFTRNFGQTAAISAAMDNAVGDIIIPMDADLQNDPHDIPLFMEKIGEGFDVVSGWRRRRKDPYLTKILPSRMANWIISVVGGVHLHDFGCSLKAYRRNVIRHVRLYGEMHRFIPLFAHQVGARTTEIEVNHRPRAAGKSKYGLSRIYKVMLDLFVVKFLSAYFTKPIYFFGSVGGFLSVAGAFFGVWTLYDKHFGVFVHKNPKILLSIFLIILGFQFIMMGLIAELLMRTYYESQEKPTYFIRDKLNFDA